MSPVFAVNYVSGTTAICYRWKLVGVHLGVHFGPSAMGLCVDRSGQGICCRNYPRE